MEGASGQYPHIIKFSCKGQNKEPLSVYTGNCAEKKIPSQPSQTKLYENLIDSENLLGTVMNSLFHIYFGFSSYFSVSISHY